LLGTDVVGCRWFRDGERGFVTVLDMTISTRESRERKGGTGDGKSFSDLQRSFLVRDGKPVNISDEVWVNWVKISSGGQGNGTLLIRKGDTIVTLILSDQDDLNPNTKELIMLGKIIERRL
jgi:hypothetical protein